METRLRAGVLGTMVSAVGAGLSVNELQAIVSIIFTVLGFIISVLVPTIIKIVRMFKEAKADGVVTDEEKKKIATEIVNDSIKVVKEGKQVIKSVSSKKEEVSEQSEEE